MSILLNIPDEAASLVAVTLALAALEHDKPGLALLAQQIKERAEPHPLAQAYRDGCPQDDDVEVDENAMVSTGDDNGAWVQAWIWVSNARAGITAYECKECNDVQTVGPGEAAKRICECGAIDQFFQVEL